LLGGEEAVRENLSQLIEVSQYFGIDISERAYRFLRAAGGNVVEPDEEDDEITRLYGELGVLADGGDERAYQTTLHRLRALQQREAERVGAIFRANRLLSSEALSQAIGRAERLLARYENPAAPDAPGSDDPR